MLLEGATRVSSLSSHEPMRTGVKEDLEVPIACEYRSRCYPALLVRAHGGGGGLPVRPEPPPPPLVNGTGNGPVSGTADPPK